MSKTAKKPATVTKLPAAVAKGAYRTKREAAKVIALPVKAKPSAKSQSGPATKAKPERKGYGAFKGKKLYPTKAVAKENPRRPTAKDRSGKRRPSNGFRALEFIRQNPGCSYDEFLAAKLRPADLRWDIAKGRVEARA